MLICSKCGEPAFGHMRHQEIIRDITPDSESELTPQQIEEMEEFAREKAVGF